MRYFFFLLLTSAAIVLLGMWVVPAIAMVIVAAVLGWVAWVVALEQSRVSDPLSYALRAIYRLYHDHHLRFGGLESHRRCNRVWNWTKPLRDWLSLDPPNAPLGRRHDRALFLATCSLAAAVVGVLRLP